MSENSSSKNAIVIGAGIAGLASAIRLQVMGYEVTVYEKNNYPGGKLSHFEINGYQFDAGPSLFTRPKLIEELFVLANEPMENYFSYERVPVACHYFYQDGTLIKAYADHEKFAEEIQVKTGEPAEHVHEYLRHSANAYENIADIFLKYTLHRLSTLFKAPVAKAIQYLKWPYLFTSLHQYNQSRFQSSKLVQLFNRYATYNGSNPYKAPAMLSLIPHLEHNEGTFYPKGGMISITRALFALAEKKGVKFIFDTPVDKIIRANNQVQGVVVNGENIMANLVVSNMDVYFTYQHLLGEPLKAKKILKQERSSSAFIFYWGMSKTFEQLSLHNIFFSEQYEAEFNSLFHTCQPFADPTVYINITSKCEPGIQAPSEKENWFVMVNAPANNGQDWDAIRDFYKKAILQKLNSIIGEDIAKYIEVEEVLSPVSIETKTASYMGSLYGTSSNSKMAAFMRHPNFSNTIKGLYFVGGSVHPGGGIPLCLSSAAIMSDLVKADVV
ncbi:1-hydroxycarotenoid 3,4-desaturase CrtD [Sediminibacterium sp. TEGAF015]|uniref:1-hydroxycarotenoid 3,4-desaturase CrtD n=1 Tax=Sediminibacterium sp. TEGAF015 TaxID=575378 RepID=UPI00220693D6|nr:1-hydroxycarotenoid 3,4-desaturase CrtD [Sediminibacterium sp. TEGAF015]BDQ13064.1 phytoene desaturase [Sediminibacterium sp. TEGAF015]